MPMTTMQLAGVGSVLLVQLFLAWRLVVTTRALDRLQARLAHQGEALSLLTDTSENGFAAIARELESAGHAGAQAVSSSEHAPGRVSRPQGPQRGRDRRG